ncbi:MAG: alanyl-tRNA editing protein [Treponema sp.]|jgi:alanyl-tRNA synthetase|nr:alanyl-tRNA editing protein [Treponema sp.]
MRTERLYYDYSSPEPFQAEIREIRPQGDRAAILLDRTIFYPEGGGQDADRGSINGVPLLDVKESGGAAEPEILHLAAAAAAENLRPGPAVLILDSRRRRDFTVQHSAQHLLSGTILRLTGKYTVSMRLGAEFDTIDVDAPELSADTLAQVEEAVADAIEADAPLLIHLCPPEDITRFPLRKVPPQGEEVIRVVEIAGHDFSPCCGTHCKSTGQIGILRILGAERYKGMTRITFIAGRRALADSRMLRRNGETISRALKVPVAETGAGVLALLERSAALERELKALREAAAEREARALLARTPLPAPEDGAAGPPVIAELYDADFDEVLRIGRAAQKETAAVLLLGSRREKKFAAFCSGKGTDLRLLLKAAMENSGGKGGGGAGFFQGVFESAAALEKFLGDVI